MVSLQLYCIQVYVALATKPMQNCLVPSSGHTVGSYHSPKLNSAAWNSVRIWCWTERRTHTDGHGHNTFRLTMPNAKCNDCNKDNKVSPAPQSLIHKWQRMPADEDDIHEVKSCLVSDWQQFSAQWQHLVPSQCRAAYNLWTYNIHQKIACFRCHNMAVSQKPVLLTHKSEKSTERKTR